MNKQISSLIILLFGSVAAYSQYAYVPDTSTAISIAEAVWLPIYGSKIYKQRPFHATLIGDSVWVVRGYKKQGGFDTLNGMVTLTVTHGGVLNAEIRKSDGKISQVYYTK